VAAGRHVPARRRRRSAVGSTAGRNASRRNAEIVVLTWEMVSTRDGTVVGGGRDVLMLDPDARIRTDQQYVG
jgi:hypothetical protein